MGVELSDLEAISLGFGTKGLAQPGGAGLVFFDDLRLHKSRCLADGPRPTGDLSGDCVVDMLDLEMLVGQWLRTGPDIEGDLDADQIVDFRDYAALTQQWLDEQLWP
jgi:hypothetical protein